MARRASSRLNPGIILGAAAAIAVAIFVGKSFIGGKSTSFSGVNAIKGQVDEKLQWTTDRGQLVSVKVETTNGDQFVGIEIPKEYNNQNIETKQKYLFRVKFRQGGIAVATGINPL